MAGTPGGAAAGLSRQVAAGSSPQGVPRPVARALRRLLRAGSFSAGLVAAACASTPSAAPPPAVGAVARALVDAVNAADVEAFLDLFAPDATVFFPSPENAARLEGLPAIRAGLGTALDAKPKIPLVMSGLSVTVSDDLAVASFEVRNPAVHSRRTLVLRLVGQQWKIIHLHASNIRREAS